MLLWCYVPESARLLTLPAVILSVAWLLSDGLRRATLASLKYVLGCDLTEPDEHSESGTSQGLSILAFILTQSIALIASQIGRIAIKDQPVAYKTTLTMAYVALTVIVLGSVVGLIRSTGIADAITDDKSEAKIDGKRTQPKRSFDRGTLTFFRWVMFWGIVTSTVIFGAAWFGLLPAQSTPKKIPLDWTATPTTVPPIQEPELKEWQPEENVGKPVVRLDVQISPLEFQEVAVPKSVTIAVSIDRDVIEKSWRIFGVVLYEGNPEKKIKHFPFADPNTNLGNPPAKPRFTVKLDELKANDSYTLCLWLYKDNASQGDVASYATELNHNKDRSKVISINALWSSP